MGLLCLCVLLTFCAFPAPGAKGRGGKNSSWDKKRQQVRVYKEARPGTPIYNLTNVVDMSNHHLQDIRFSLRGKDRRKFSINDGILVVGEGPNLGRGIGSKYYVTVQVYKTGPSKEILNSTDFMVLVSKRNRFSPKFDRDRYVGYVSRYSVTGVYILKVEVSDRDQEDYNNYSRLTLLSKHNKWIKLNSTSGSLNTGQSFRHAPAILYGQFIAENVHGSPILSAKAPLKIMVCNTTEPHSVIVMPVNSTTVSLCWSAPKRGKPEYYRVTHTEKDHTPTTYWIKRIVNKNASVCVPLLDLAPLQNYWVQIKAVSVEECGIGTTIEFKTMGEPNVEDSCGKGRDRECPTKKINCSKPSQTNKECMCQNKGVYTDGPGEPRCRCPSGFVGKLCEIQDPCVYTSCEHGGSCVSTISGDFRCSCKSGYYGVRCELFNPCSLNPCKKGECVNKSSSEYVCNCQRGYSGGQCERFNPCISSPCLNNGRCLNHSESTYTCRCQPGFQGVACDIYDPCYNDPCQYGGMCNSIDGHYLCACEVGRFGATCERTNLCLTLDPCEHAKDCQNTSDTTYKCFCRSGWHGQNCTESDLCQRHRCKNGGRCQPVTKTKYKCLCDEPYTGTWCESETVCSSSPCLNGATCKSGTAGGYTCICPEGYSSKNCEVFNPCISNPCKNDGTCIEYGNNKYRCECPSFYSGKICQEFDQCSKNPCRRGSTCINTREGTYQCVCTPGRFGRNCGSRDPCYSSPCMNNATCHNTSDEQYICSCRSHFYGNHCEHFDSCASNPCHRGDCRSLSGGRYRCVCPDGLFGTHCDSYDPCQGQICQNGGSCVPRGDLTAQCHCPLGYYGARCEFHNPCVFKPCKNEGTCLNISTHHHICRCSDRFYGDLCEFKVACGRPGVECENQGFCQKSKTDIAECVCPRGYFGLRCEHKNRCLLDAKCVNKGICVNMSDTEYRCQCLQGYSGKTCDRFTKCDVTFCKNGGTCVETPVANLCYCDPGFTGQTCEIELDECVSNPCIHGVCLDGVRRYRCICAPGYRGTNCDQPATCSPEVYYDIKGTFMWPTTIHGHTHKLPCPMDAKHKASRRCVALNRHSARWEEPDTSPCRLDSTSPANLRRTLKPFQNASVALRTGREVAAAVKLLQKVWWVAPRDEEAAVEMLKVVDALLDIDDDGLLSPNLTRIVRKVLQDLISAVNLPTENVWSVHLRNIVATSTLIFSNSREENYVLRSSEGPEGSLTLPKPVFRDKSYRVNFIYYRNSRLFRQSDGTSTEAREVLTASIIDTVVTGADPCILINLPTYEKSEERSCVFWNDEGMRWSRLGVRTVLVTEAVTKCCSTHLTDFSLVKVVAMEPSMKQRDWLLEYVILACCGLSIACLSLSLLVYSISRALHRRKYGQLLIQLCLSMVLLEVSLLMGYDKEQISLDIMCLAVGVAAHYASLSSVLWMCMFAHHVYRLHLRSSEAKEKFFTLKRTLIGWGMPVIPVTIQASLEHGMYVDHKERCWTATRNIYLYYGTWLGPSALVLFVNGIIFVLLTILLLWPRKNKNEAIPMTRPKILPCQLLMFVVALHWTCTLLLDRQDLHPFISKHEDIIKYAFYGSSCLPGVIILVFYILGHGDARQAVANCRFRSVCIKRKKISMKERSDDESLAPSDGNFKHDLHDSSRPLALEDDVPDTPISDPQNDSCGRVSVDALYENGKARVLWLNKQYSPIDTDCCPDSPRMYQSHPRSTTSSRKSYGKMMTSDI